MFVPTLSLNTEHILQLCKQQTTGVLLIIAPTGTGKTMGMKSLVQKHPRVYGRTVMVQPTKMTTHTMTALQLVHHYLRHGRFLYDTLVLDEVHSQCVEYHTLLSILQKTRAYETIRVVLMSATPCVRDLEQFFPKMRVHRIQAPPPFPIQVEYEPLDCPFPSYRQMVYHVSRVLKKHPHHKRVLVFVYTHDQCDKMATAMKDLATHYNQGKTFALYGGMDKKEMDQWHEFLRDEERFVIIATNVAETSLTIPDLSLVIDFGIRCIQRNNRIVYNPCPQSNMVQRSGRTGRTCPGVVVRCMRQEDFENRPEQDSPEYNWDMMVLRMLRHRPTAVALLPDHVHQEQILRKFRFYRLLGQQGLDKDMVSFVLECPLLLKNSCHLYHFLKSHHHQPETILYLMSTALIDQMESRMSRIYYYSYEDRKISRQQFFKKVRRIFSNPKDELLVYLNMVVSCIRNEKPVEFSNAFSLNFRSIRQMSAAITRLCNFVLGKGHTPWQDQVGGWFQTKTEWDLEKKMTHPVLQLKEVYADRLRHLYMTDPLVPKLLLVNDMLWRPNFIAESHNCIVQPFSQNHFENRCVLLLSYDDTEVDKWSDPSTPLTDITTLSFSLYTLLPTKIGSFLHKRADAVQRGVWERNQRKKQKGVVRKRFQPVLRDIQDDVAYRPGFWKMETALQDLSQDISYFSEKIKNCFQVGNQVCCNASQRS